jgi:hypothetical protein
VSEIITSDPFCVGPATTVGDAMKVVITLRFRHGQRGNARQVAAYSG